MTGSARKTGTWLPGLCLAGLVAACGDEPRPTPVSEFVDNPILLEATMVRCMENRAEARYDPECINAGDAVDRIAAAQDDIRRAELEAQSERKRQALRRAQEAATEARRRAQEEQRRREEAEYLGQFEPLPEVDRNGETGRPDAAAEPDERPDRTAVEHNAESAGQGTAVPSTLDEAPPADPIGDQSTDLDAIRRELERRPVDPEKREER